MMKHRIMFYYFIINYTPYYIYVILNNWLDDYFFICNAIQKYIKKRESYYNAQFCNIILVNNLSSLFYLLIVGYNEYINTFFICNTIEYNTICS